MGGIFSNALHAFVKKNMKNVILNIFNIEVSKKKSLFFLSGFC